jgi:predicted nucleotidyltransferase
MRARNASRDPTGEITSGEITDHLLQSESMITTRQISALARQIAEQFSPEQVILFGSYAYGTPTPHSDVDLLIIMPVKGEPVDKAIEIRLAIDVTFPVDLLVRTPAQIKTRLKMNDYFMQDIIEKGRKLYDRSDRRVGRKSRRRFQHRAARVARS